MRRNCQLLQIFADETVKVEKWTQAPSTESPKNNNKGELVVLKQRIQPNLNLHQILPLEKYLFRNIFCL